MLRGVLPKVRLREVDRYLHLANSMFLLLGKYRSCTAYGAVLKGYVNNWSILAFQPLIAAAILVTAPILRRCLRWITVAGAE